MSTRYILYDEIGAGGMAKVHLGRLQGALGFSRVVAIKRLHPALSLQPDAVAMLVDEARIAARVRHPNVIPTLEVLIEDGECLLVMEYVEGESLARLLRASSAMNEPVPVRTSVSVISSVLHGLHAAHTARSAHGEPLGIMHRDVSPQNILIGVDGVVRIFDFGIAKALGRLQETRTGRFKGKLAYAAPEQLNGERLTQRVDIYAASVALWESLTLERLFQGESEEATFGKVMRGEVPPPSSINPHVPPALDALVLRGLSRAPEERFPTAEAMAVALEAILPIESPRTIGSWVKRLAAPKLLERAALVAAVEKGEPQPAESERPPEPAPNEETTLLVAAVERPVLGADEPNATPSVGGTAQNVATTAAKRRGVHGMATTAAALALLGAGTVFGLGRLESRATAAAVRDGTPPTAPVASHPPPPAAATIAVSVAPRSPLPSSPASARPKPAQRTQKRAPSSTAAMTRGATPTDPCAPPYVVVQGIKIFKEQCF